MTDNEIIKALECCNEIKISNCDECPLLYDECSKYDLYKLALDLINRQRAEIDRLNGCVKSEDEVRAIMKSQMTPMVNEIVNEQFDKAVKLAKAEAIKELVKRLKDRVVKKYAYTDVRIFNEIDNLVNEMVGDAE